jgi:hypothetical protein
MAEKKKCVMISSTVRDLPEHRGEVRDACLRQGMFPTMMENLPASDAEAISASIKMVDEADIYVGVLAYRYGYIPKDKNAKQISVTEMEYDRAIERKIPRLIFVMDKSHPITADDMDIGNAAKLKAFKERVQAENIVNFFKSPADLRANVINSLSQYRESNITQFHFVSDIPQPPEPYIAHPYTLLRTHRLIGRQEELNLLTNWVTKKHVEIYSTRILSVVAIGGMGKSALIWKWFNDIAPQEMKPLTGRIWWSFYESDASFENFVIRALAYLTCQPHEEVQKISPPEREEQLLKILDQEPFLLVLDGLERILLAYARMDAARLADDDIDQRTANYVARAYVLPKDSAQSFVGQHLLRKTADPRAGSFLRKLANVRAARILVSTRLYPADLQTPTGELIQSCSAIFMRGLNDDDALDLWRAFTVSGSRETLLPMFHKFENHPLLIQSLASEVGNYRRAPGDFERWLKDHPTFNPFNMPMVNARAHVLEFALRNLDGIARKVLFIIAAFRMPVSYDTLVALLVGYIKPCANEHDLDMVLIDLTDRGLVGWDKRANRYDLHPIVRSAIWNELDNNILHMIYTTLREHFESLPKFEESKVKTIDDLTSTIELYNTLIGLQRFDDAFRLFLDHLYESLFLKLGNPHQSTELLEMLFPNGTDQLPMLTPGSQPLCLHLLALSYDAYPKQAEILLTRANDIDELNGDYGSVSIGLATLAEVLCFLGKLRESEVAARRSLQFEHSKGDRKFELSALSALSWNLVIRGIKDIPEVILRREILLLETVIGKNVEDFYFFHQIQRMLWLPEEEAALRKADQAWDFIQNEHAERDLISVARMQGVAALRLNDFPRTDERLHYALTHARTVNFVREELQALISMAELRRRQKDLKTARELLGDVWEPAERGPYPLFHADAFNILAQIERDAGNYAAAVDAATKAYRLAWCDGEPFAYHWGLVVARKHLKELGAPEPEMPPFDESKYKPMPEVEINPDDEFHIIDEDEIGK